MREINKKVSFSTVRCTRVKYRETPKVAFLEHWTGLYFGFDKRENLKKLLSLGFGWKMSVKALRKFPDDFEGAVNHAYSLQINPSYVAGHSAHLTTQSPAVNEEALTELSEMDAE